MIDKLLETLPQTLTNIKEKVPLTHCITNAVTINDCANAVLAIGGSPVMVEDADEVEEFVQIADCLVINIGKVSKDQIEAMRVAAKYATKTNTPIVIDPVGIGVSKLRNDLILDLLKEDITAIRGNLTEIKTIANLLELTQNSNTAKGVDANEDDLVSEDNIYLNVELIKKLAAKTNSIIIASGAIDIISDGETVVAVENGDEMMAKITGSGCMLSSVVATSIAGSNSLDGSVFATIAMGIAGEKARIKVEEENLGTGSFRTFLIDYLSKTSEDQLLDNAKIRIL